MFPPIDGNPEELCSRGTSPAELAKSQLWCNGHEWLMKARNEWPDMQQARKPKSHVRNENSKETGNRDYHMCGSAGKQTSDCGKAKSICYQYWLETEVNALLKLEPINTCSCQSKEGSPQQVKDGREPDQ